MQEDFQKHGFTLLPQKLPEEWIRNVSKIGTEIYERHMGAFGKPKSFGSTHHWKTMDMYSSQYPILFNYLTSSLMAEIVADYLGSNAYLFNDQFVFKKPKDSWSFPWHTDNIYTPEKGRLLNDHKALTACWFLTDNNEKCGGIKFLSKQETTHEELESLSPMEGKHFHFINAQAGDVGIWDGNTLHSSSGNESDQPRNVWLQVYSTKPLGKNFKNGYYHEQFLRDGIRILGDYADINWHNR